MILGSTAFRIECGRSTSTVPPSTLPHRTWHSNLLRRTDTLIRRPQQRIKLPVEIRLQLDFLNLLPSPSIPLSHDQRLTITRLRTRRHQASNPPPFQLNSERLPLGFRRLHPSSSRLHNRVPLSHSTHRRTVNPSLRPLVRPNSPNDKLRFLPSLLPLLHLRRCIKQSPKKLACQEHSRRPRRNTLRRRLDRS